MCKNMISWCVLFLDHFRLLNIAFKGNIQRLQVAKTMFDLDLLAI